MVEHMGARFDRAESKDHQNAGAEEFKPNYDIDGMRHPPLNKMSYDANKPAVCLDGPKLPDLKIDASVDNNKHYQDIARKAAEFVAINGSYNIAMRHALKDANENDKLQGDGKGHKTVDKLLEYINKELCGTYFSMIRRNDKIILLDSRDNDPVKHDAAGKAQLNIRGSWSLGKEPYDKRYY